MDRIWDIYKYHPFDDHISVQDHPRSRGQKVKLILLDLGGVTVVSRPFSLKRVKRA